MNDVNYTVHPLMYYVQPTNEVNGLNSSNNYNSNNTITSTMTQPHDMYYSPSLPGSSAQPIIPSPSEMDPNTMQPPLPLSIISNPLLPITTTTPTTSHGQPFDHHPQELSPQETSIYSVPSSVIDEDMSSRNSSSVNGNGTGNGGQEAYIQQLQKQVEESKHLQTQYYYRIEQLMTLVEKQTARINELQEQVSQTTMHDPNGDGFQQQQYSLQQTSSIQHHH